MNKQTKPAVTKPADDAVINRFELGQQAARTAAQADDCLEKAAEQLAEALKGASFDTWEIISADFKAVYQEARKVSEAAANMAWSRTVQKTGLQKPAKPTAAGQKKAEQRAKAKAELENKTEAELKAVIETHKAAAAEGDTKAAAEIKAAKKAIESKAAELNKAANTELKELRAEINGLLKGAGRDVLHKVLAIIKAETAGANIQNIVSKKKAA